MPTIQNQNIETVNIKDNAMRPITTATTIEQQNHQSTEMMNANEQQHIDGEIDNELINGQISSSSSTSNDLLISNEHQNQITGNEHQNKPSLITKTHSTSTLNNGFSSPMPNNNKFIFKRKPFFKFRFWPFFG